MRDWSTLRNREWQPTGASAASAQASAGDECGRKAADASSAEPYGGGYSNSYSDGHSSASSSQPNGRGRVTGFRTDTEISGAKQGGERKLQRWADTEPEAPAQQLESLEEFAAHSGNHHARSSGSNKQWDQFRVNYELFGVVSTYRADMSQYTTPLDPSRVPAELRRKAERIAAEIDKTGRSHRDEPPAAWDCDNEEDLWSAVPRADGYNTWPPYGNGGYNSHGGGEGGGEAAQAPAAPSVGLDGGIGAALLNTLRAAAPVASPGDGDWRSMLSPKVHSWWKAREVDGETLPPGEERSIVCPFSRKVFGDVSQLVMHWAAALPRAPDGEKEAATSCAVATEQFRHASGGVRFTELVTAYKLADALSVDAPKQGSVWEQVLTRMGRASSAEKGPIAERLIVDFVTEVVGMKCWRRDQKVELRDLQESIAAALAMHIIDTAGGRTWQYPADS